MIALITCAVLIGLMLLGVPVCAAMGGTGNPGGYGTACL